MQKLKNYQRKFLLCSLLLLSIQICQALDPPDEPGTVDPAAPIDGGLSLLLAAGVAYGASRCRKPKGHE